MPKKMRKQNQLRKTPPMEDRISALPDEILRYILSFLPTKLAFTTSVLSKRWNPICYSLTTLHFDDKAEEDVETYTRFRRFVDNVLLSPRVQHHPIETLSIVSHSELCHDLSRRFNMDEWIEAAKRRGVKNFQLSSSTIHIHLRLLPSIFSSFKTLVVLKLSGIIIEYGTVGPVDFPSLTTLHLIGVLFCQRDGVMKILNGCPIVEDLYVTAPSFELGYPTGFKPMPQVVKAHINAFNVPFNAIPNVESLHIEEIERRDKDNYINSYYRQMPVFRNLISIELTFHRFRGWFDVVEVLPYCPNLQSLAIEKGKYRTIIEANLEHTIEPAVVPECVSLHLRTCSVRNYPVKSMYEDFDLAAYILQNARVLQVLTIHIDPHHSTKSEKDQLFKYLSRCPKISQTCEIECY
ncbi:FBD-associated F-box protein At4g10400-like [Lotus japonicus]|uniref:FBD-associated F-box protein At4g10400-like n=1 Tax=Lotus japonicus TaxID=34305 RepID=UPI00258AC691|nr:FBD-associated F-box protein At4g10400-like [Lotus japonicus]